MTKLRVIVALLLTTAAIGGSAVSVQAAPDAYLEEVNETSLATQAWARSAIHWGFADGLTVGIQNEPGWAAFLPDHTISRAEAVTMLTKFKEINIDDYRKDSTVFTDVNGAWYTPYVNAAFENGIVAGKGKGIFDPTGTLTRAEAVTMIVKAMGYQPTGEEVLFEDIDGAWYTDYIKTANNHKIVAGKTKTQFDPNGKVTRAEFIMMLYNTQMSGIEKGMYTAVMIANDAESFELEKNGEIVLTYDSETKAVTGATKVKQFANAETGDWQMVYFDPMNEFRLIPKEDGKITGLRFFANGHEVNLSGSRMERVFFYGYKKVTSYRDEIGKMYPKVCFSLNPFGRADLSINPLDYENYWDQCVILSDDGTFLAGHTENFELSQTEFPMGKRIVTHENSEFVQHSTLDGVCMEAGACFDNGAMMLFADRENGIYVMDPDDSPYSELWIGGEKYTIELDDEIRIKDVTVNYDDYDQDGDKEYLLTAYNPESGESKDCYLIEVKEDKSIEVRKLEGSEEVDPEDEDKEFPPQVTLSGDHDDHLITDKLCYVEGDKFFLLLDKDVDLPGDFADNVALIIDEIEKEIGLTFAVDRPLMRFDNCTVFYGYNPWEDFPFGQKVPIFIKVDREEVGYISIASAEYADIFDYDLYSMDLWNSVPGYRDNPERRFGCVDYYTIAHELTHVLTQRYATLPKIMTEGGADYVAERVIHSLSSVSADFAGSVEIMSFHFTDHVKDEVTPENAEDIFRNDYKDLSHAERQDEYTLGRMICNYLRGLYGDSSYRDYIIAAQKAGYAYGEFISVLSDADRDKLTEVFKETFGEDSLKNFGTYYQEHKSE